MYSKFKELIIGRDIVAFELIDTDVHFEYELDYNVDDWRTQRGTLADNDDYSIKVDGKWIYIDDKLHNFKEMIYLPYEVRTIICKDIRKDLDFELSYRQHLRQVFSKTEMVVVNMNHIPDELNFKVEQVRKCGEKFSYGKAEKPIVVLFHSDNTLHYTILKDEVIVESGAL